MCENISKDIKLLNTTKFQTLSKEWRKLCRPFTVGNDRYLPNRLSLIVLYTITAQTYESIIRPWSIIERQAFKLDVEVELIAAAVLSSQNIIP